MAIITDVGIPGAGTGYIYQPKLKNRYVAIFYAPTGLLQRAATELGNNAANAVGNTVTSVTGSNVLGSKITSQIQQMISLGGGQSITALSSQCTKFDRPKINFEPITLYRYNSNVKISQSKYEIPTISLVLEDDITNFVSKAVQQLLNNQHSLISTGSNPYMSTAPTANRYKFSVDLVSLDGGTNKVEIFNFSGCWLQNIDWGDNSYEDGTQATINITMSVDHFQQTFNDLDTFGQAVGGLNDTSDYSLIDSVYAKTQS
jgi:hypothetical protein